jgi:hypothetical protein
MKARVRITRKSPLKALELGFAQLADLTGTVVTHTQCRHPERRDAEAIASDWRHVGKDIYAASRKADRCGLAK